MEQLGRRTLYTDTDSIRYVHKSGEWNPDFLATSWEGLKDEYPHKGLTQYLGLGAKNDAIRFTDDTSECKVRAFTLNYQTSKMIDFDTMLEMLQKKKKKKKKKNPLTQLSVVVFRMGVCSHPIFSFTVHNALTCGKKRRGWADQTTKHNVHASIVSSTLREKNHC